MLEIKRYTNRDDEYWVIKDRAKEEKLTINEREEKCLVLNYMNTWWLYEQNVCKPLSKNYWMFHEFVNA